jgi:hypothetical protein
MSAEFYVTFGDLDWYISNKTLLEEKISSLSTFSKNNTDTQYWSAEIEAEYWLTRTELRHADCWDFDVRFLFTAKYVLLEITCHPPSIAEDLKILFAWLRQLTYIDINDEDGDPSGW